jgi:cytoskeletal protein RodZ
MHKWHFIIEKNEKIIEQPIKSEEIITESKNQEKKINPSQEFIPIENETIEKKLKKEQKEQKVKKKEQKIKKKEQKRKKKDKPIKLLNMIIVVIISVAALIIIIDTFRIELSKYMPFLNPMLDSFYAIITDINSFIKDLIR